MAPEEPCLWDLLREIHAWPVGHGRRHGMSSETYVIKGTAAAASVSWTVRCGGSQLPGGEDTQAAMGRNCHQQPTPTE